MNAQSRAPLVQRYLDPATSLGEVLFGLIMTLTFTLGAGIIIEDRRARRRTPAADRGDRLQRCLGHHRRARCTSWASCSTAGATGDSGGPCARPATRRRGRRWSRASWTSCSATSPATAEREVLYARIVDNLRAMPETANPAAQGRRAGRDHQLLAGRADQRAGRDSLPADRRRATGAARVERDPARAAVLHRLLVGALHAQPASGWSGCAS